MSNAFEGNIKFSDKNIHRRVLEIKLDKGYKRMEQAVEFLLDFYDKNKKGRGK